MHFDVTLLNDQECKFALWYNGFNGLATGHAVKGDTRAQMKRDFKGELIKDKHIALCKRLDILR
jgi:hypothetical protein